MRPLSHSAEPVAPLFHVTQSCEPAPPRFGWMSVKMFQVKRAVAVMSAKVDMKPRAEFHVTHGAPALAATMFHVTQLSEPAQKRLGLWSGP